MDLRATSLVVLAFSAIGSGCRRSPPASEPAVAGASATSKSSAPPSATAPIPVASASVVSPNPHAVRSQADCPQGMLFIPAADFTVTMPDVWDPKRNPRKQRLQVEAFCIDRTEMPRSRYPVDKCGRQNQTCDLNAAGLGPATCVSLRQAKCACAEATPGTAKRLPTDPEWVLAAVGTDGRRYPWGNNPYPEGYKIGENFCPQQAQMPTRDMMCPVDKNTLDAGPFGVIGMASNGSEMTTTCSGPSAGVPQSCVVRAADFTYGPLEVPGTVINDDGPFGTGVDLSFRCVTSERARD